MYDIIGGGTEQPRIEVFTLGDLHQVCAQNPEEVEMVANFVWFDDPNHKDRPYTGLEAAPKDFQDQWFKAYNICLNKE